MEDASTPREAYSPISDVDPDEWWESAGFHEGPISPTFFDPGTDHVPKLGPALPLPEGEAEKEAQMEAEMHARLRKDLDEGDRARKSLWAEINLPPWLADPGKRLDDYKADSSKSKSEKADWHRSEQGFHPWEDYKRQNSSESEDELGDWPRRLLHVHGPTMISYEWQPGNRYGPIVNPRYAAISYTWGRWALPDRVKPWIESLRVENSPWAIPRIDEELFTVTEFQQAINTCVSSKGNLSHLQFIWLDVACINQSEGDKSGALEIGRQAKIFGRADRVFVWLTENATTRTHGQWDCFESSIRFVEQAASFTENIMPQILLEKEKPDESVHINNGQEVYGLLDELFDRERTSLVTLNTAIRFVTKAPWFSSLWTLQEAFLRTDSSFLMPDGSLLVDEGGARLTVSSLVKACDIIYKACTASAEGRSRTDSLHEQLLLHSINSNGLDALSSRNPMALYTSANLRQTQRPLDRIYGIMQVFGFRLGDASPVVDAGREWTLDDLEIEMGAALLEKFPVMSQLHVHRSSISGRQGWRISNSSIIPALARNLPYTEKGEIKGKVDTFSLELSVKKADNCVYGYFKSKACKFETLKDAWAASDGHQRSMKSKDFRSIVHVALDSTMITSKPSLQIRQHLHDIPRDHQQHTLLHLLGSNLRRANKQALIVLLGRIFIGEEARCGKIPPGSTETYVGMILMECHDNTIGRWWKRLGICTWDVQQATSMESSSTNGHVPILRGDPPDWIILDGLFG